MNQHTTITTSHDQPPPKPNDRPAVWNVVMQDMRERDQVGRQRYGTPLQPHNGRDALADAFSEALDLSVYLRQAMLEMSTLGDDLRAVYQLLISGKQADVELARDGLDALLKRHPYLGGRARG